MGTLHRTALVLGATGQLGADIARRMVGLTSTLVLHGPDEHALADLRAELAARPDDCEVVTETADFASLDALHQLIAQQGKAEFADVLGRAAIGLARDDALVAVAHAWRAWAREHPGRYQISQRAPAAGDASHQAVADRFVGAVAARAGSPA